MLRFCLEGFLTKANLVMHAHAQFFLSLVKRFVSITLLDRYYPSISGALQFLLKPPLESEQSRIVRSVPFRLDSLGFKLCRDVCGRVRSLKILAICDLTRAEKSTLILYEINTGPEHVPGILTDVLRSLASDYNICQ